MTGSFGWSRFVTKIFFRLRRAVSFTSGNQANFSPVPISNDMLSSAPFKNPGICVGDRFANRMPYAFQEVSVITFKSSGQTKVTFEFLSISNILHDNCLVATGCYIVHLLRNAHQSYARFH